ncbi:MAG TPA: IclR family transcriptional regulator [Desulfotignum sp.]|nr:IclR family transcriptional regulator [Desulfotignum sp.]
MSEKAVFAKTDSGNKRNAIEKAMEILLKFQDIKASWGIRELSAELGFSPATVQRILSVLKSYGFVRQDDQTRQYYVGNIFYRFLENLNHANNITGIGRQFMEAVAIKTRETVYLNIIQGNLRICIDTIESPKALKAGMPIGNQSPLYAGASAKCLLAFSSAAFQKEYFAAVAPRPLTDATIVDPDALAAELTKIQTRGYAVSLGERTPGLGSVSAPVFNYRGKILASLSLAVPEIRTRDKAHFSLCITILTDAARAFSLAMGQPVTQMNATHNQLTV